METHVKVVGALQVAMGALGLFFAAILAVIMGGAASIVGVSGDPDAAIAVPIIGITGVTLVVFLVALSLPSVFIGVGLFRLRPWARIAGIVISILSLMMIPFGTILGVYGLWVLFSRDTERLFMTPASPAPPTV